MDVDVAPQAAQRQAGKDARLKHILMRGDSQLAARNSQQLVGHETFVGALSTRPKAPVATLTSLPACSAHMEQIAGLVRVIYLSGNIKKHTVSTHTQTATQQLNIYRVRVTHESRVREPGGGSLPARHLPVCGELLPESCASSVWPAELGTAT